MVMATTVECRRRAERCVIAAAGSGGTLIESGPATAGTNRSRPSSVTDVTTQHTRHNAYAIFAPAVKAIHSSDTSGSKSPYTRLDVVYPNISGASTCPL